MSNLQKDKNNKRETTNLYKIEGELKNLQAAVDAVKITTGAFTPGVSFGGGTTGITYSTQSGIYYRMGNVIFVQGSIVLTSKGSSSGVVLITNLPFTINGSNPVPVCALKMNHVTYTGMIIGSGMLGDITIQLLYFPETGTLVELTDANFANNSIVRFSMVYFI